MSETKRKKEIEESEEEPEVPEEDKKVSEEIDQDLEAETAKRVYETPEERAAREAREKLKKWVPKTELGREILNGKITNIDELLNSGRKIMEPEIVDSLLDLKIELLNIGKAKGKFGGGKRRAWRQTQKKTQEGNIPTFSVMVVVGDKNGHVGLGVGRAKETLPAKEKAIRKAKLNIIRIKRGCASYDCLCNDPHSIPMATKGGCSSVIVNLMPAPQGTGLVAGDELKKVLKLAGIKDIYSKTFGKTRTTINTAKACIAALEKLNEIEEK